MRYILTIFLTTLWLNSWSQECSPYRPVTNWELSDSKHYALAYVSCFHARGIVAEVGYDPVFVGFLTMGKRHHNDVYSYLQYEFVIRESRIYIGPAYRLNNNPSLLIGRMGIDYKIYKPLYTTLSLLQVNNKLNYVHIGLKLVF